MSNINDRVAYLKGLAEGMKLTDETNEGKLLLKMLDAMQDMAEEITAPREDSVATMRELRKYTPKLSPAKPRQPLT